MTICRHTTQSSDICATAGACGKTSGRKHGRAAHTMHGPIGRNAMQLELMERQERDVGLSVKVKATVAQYVEGEDIVDFLRTFERSMELHQIPQGQWLSQLLRVVTGKARACCFY